MTNSVQIINEQLDYKILLLTHIICADRQIHSKELKCLYKLVDQSSIEQQTREEMERILAQEDGHISFNYLANKVTSAEQSEVMKQILEIAYADGFYAPSEQEMVAYIAQLWNWSSSEIEQIIEKVQRSNSYHPSKDDDQNSKLSLPAYLLKNKVISGIFRPVINIGTKLAPESIGRTFEQIEREILLAGPEYQEAIQQCAKIASEDYEYTKKALNQTEAALKDLTRGLEQVIQKIHNKTSINSKATSAREVAKQLETSKQTLRIEIINDIEKIQESLRAKQRALNYFSIAFMGKSKAGKSTLHAIITQDGWEAIGVGKQRTTRLNRVYEWKNIRIIDTPGIGAPGGRTDEEVAENVIDESDVICYVVTNDSIQETEFKFLKLLKEKAKPLIVLLNLKYNLRDSRRLEHFLNNPDKLFAKDGQSGIGGHIERIRRYASEHYANDYFDIIPVMLLAAQLSGEPEHQEQKKKLLEASQIQDFLDSIRESLIKHGAIRRSQTFLGCTVGSINVSSQWLTQQIQDYRRLANTLLNKHQSIKQDIQKAEKDACECLQQQIEAIFQDAVNAVPSFAEEYWDADETKMEHGWKKKISSIKFEERLKNAYHDSADKFNSEVQEILEEVGRELQIIAQLNTNDFNFKQQDSESFKNFFRVGGTLLSLAGTIVALFALPVGFFMIIAGTIIGFISAWFKSREQKRREAVQKISNSLSVETHRPRSAMILAHEYPLFGSQQRLQHPKP